MLHDASAAAAQSRSHWSPTPKKHTAQQHQRQAKEEKEHHSEGWKMAPAGTIPFKKKTKTKHAGTKQSVYGFEAGSWVHEPPGGSVKEASLSLICEETLPSAGKEGVSLRPTWQRPNKMCLWDDFLCYWQYRCFFLFVFLKKKVEEGIKKSVRLQWRVAGIRKTLPQIQKKKNIKSNTIGSALLQVRGELGKVKNQVCLSTSTNQYHICGISLPIQSNKTKSRSSWAGAVAPGVWKLKEGARPLLRHPERIPK